MGHKIDRTLVGELLHKLDYSLQANRKTREGSTHADHDAQFHSINDRVKEALASNNPAISVDTKKKELVGDFKNAGVNGGRRVRPRPFACTTSSFPNSGELFRMASTTLPATWDGGAWGSIMTRPPSRSTSSTNAGIRRSVSSSIGLSRACLNTRRDRGK